MEDLGVYTSGAVSIEELEGPSPLFEPERVSDSIALLIVDEHAVMRAGVRSLIENEGGVNVAEADSVAEAVDMVRATAPDVILMDVTEATAETVDDMRRLQREAPDMALVVMADNDGDDEVYRAVVGGAAGHVANTAQPSELVDTIRRAATGESPISDTLAQRPEVGRRVLEAFARMSARGAARPDPKLSERDLHILSCAANGMTNQQIGREIGMSEHTVKASISRMLNRLGLRHRTEAVVLAIRQGWIQSPTAAPSFEGSRPFVEP
jgi:DNA-binding NarL/FixJ family response regulator